jgi:transcription factor S
MIFMKFCKCGSIMVPSDEGGLKCRKCGAKARLDSDDETKISTQANEKKETVVLEKDEVTLPTLEKECPICENMQAYYWLIQTRASDEPPTQFYRCTKCRHTWRVY